MTTNEDDLLMDACSDQKGSGLVICLTRIRRHVSLSLSLSLFMDFVGIAMSLLVEAAYGFGCCSVVFLLFLIFSWPVFMQWICNLSDNKKSGVSILSHFSVSSPVCGFYFVFVSLWFPKANFVVANFIAKLQPQKLKRNMLSLLPCFFRKKIHIVEKFFFEEKLGHILTQFINLGQFL
jgi:hypothetical protein